VKQKLFSTQRVEQCSRLLTEIIVSFESWKADQKVSHISLFLWLLLWKKLSTYVFESFYWINICLKYFQEVKWNWSLCRGERVVEYEGERCWHNPFYSFFPKNSVNRFSICTRIFAIISSFVCWCDFDVGCVTGWYDILFFQLPFTTHLCSCYR
jgi:hypothetical protein